MRQFGRMSKKDAMYIVTLKNGETSRVRACKVVPSKTDNGTLVYFHSNSYNATPVVFNADDILTVENDGKVAGIAEFIIGLIGGGSAGAVVWVLTKNLITCTIKNPLLNKFFTVIVIGGTTYVVATAIANVLTEQSMDLLDTAGYVYNTTKDAVKERFFKKDNMKEVGPDEDA